MRLFSCLVALPLGLAASFLELWEGGPADRWIVVLKDKASTAEPKSGVPSTGFHPHLRKADAVWDFDGFTSFAMTGSKAISKNLADHGSVAAIEPDWTGNRLISTWSLEPFRLVPVKTFPGFRSTIKISV
jgi:hypothetical protein